MTLDFLKKLFQRETPNSDSLFTSITRPLSYWFILISFLVLVFLVSFSIAKDSNALNYLKEILIVVIGFYFAGRSAEKISKVKNSNESNNFTNNLNNKLDNNFNINSSDTNNKNDDLIDSPIIKTKDQI